MGQYSDEQKDVEVLNSLLSQRPDMATRLVQATYWECDFDLDDIIDALQKMPTESPDALLKAIHYFALLDRTDLISGINLQNLDSRRLYMLEWLASVRVFLCWDKVRGIFAIRDDTRPVTHADLESTGRRLPFPDWKGTPPDPPSHECDCIRNVPRVRRVL